jgi:hypothetical protein
MFLQGLAVRINYWANPFERGRRETRGLFRGGLGVSERVGLSWEAASFAIIAALAWFSASLGSYPQVTVKRVSRASVEITAALPSLGPRMVAIEDDRELPEDDPEPCGLPGMWLVPRPSLTLSQIVPPETVSLSFLTSAQLPLRC